MLAEVSPVKYLDEANIHAVTNMHVMYATRLYQTHGDSCIHIRTCICAYTCEHTLWICPGLHMHVLKSISPNTADVLHVTISVTMLPMSSLMLVGTVLNLVMFTVIAYSGNRWVRGRDRVPNPIDKSVILDWNSSAVMSATCTPSMSTVYRSVG